MASAGTVTFELDANGVKLLRELLKAQKATKRTASTMQRDMQRSFAAIKKAAITAGSAIALIQVKRFVADIVRAGVQAEKFGRAFKVATGSAEAGRREFQFVVETSKRLGLSLEQTADSYSRMAAAARGTSLAGQASRDIFLGMSAAATVMGSSAAQAQQALVAIEQIMSKGKVQAEELRKQLGNVLPGAFQIAARAIGKTTAELDAMLSAGQLTAKDLLPALGTELTRVFGPQLVEAANSAQGAINRFNTSLFELKVRIAESGLLDVMTELANKMSSIIAPSLKQQIESVSTGIAVLSKRIEEHGGDSGLEYWGQFGTTIGRDADRVKILNNELTELLRLQGDLISGPAEVLGFIIPETKHRELDPEVVKRYEAWRKELEQIAKTVKATIDPTGVLVEKILQARRAMEAGDLTENQFKIFRDTIINETIPAVEILEMETGRTTDTMVEMARQAARNMQDAFAEFLFNPFEDGVNGMVKAFLDAIRRMLANQAALKLFSFLKGLVNPGDSIEEIDLSTLPKPRALGGPVTGGDPFLVGERGPELFVPGSSGMVIPNNRLQAAAGVNINIGPIDASGADADRILATLPPMLEQAVQESVGRMYELRDKGRF